MIIFGLVQKHITRIAHYAAPCSLLTAHGSLQFASVSCSTSSTACSPESRLRNRAIEISP